MKLFFSRILLLLVVATPAQPAFAAQIGAAVPIVRQKTDSECGRAVVASLIARRGGDIEEIYRRVAAPETPGGYSIRELLSQARRFGVHLTRHVPAGVVIGSECQISEPVLSHLKTLTVLVNTGKPVVVPVQLEDVGGHFVILTSFDEQTNVFTFADPMHDRPRQWTAGELAIRMCKFGFLAFEAR